MKTLIKIVIVLLYSNYSFSQIYYSHYLDETSEWRVVEHNGDASSHFFYFETIFFDGFENIDGFTYYKMYMTYYYIEYDIIYSQVVSPQSNNYTQFIGYFREDASGKFYLKYQNQNEFVYFDNSIVLSSLVGDLFVNFADPYYFPNDTSCSIILEDYISISGFDLKHLQGGYYDSNGNVFTNQNILEGVGIINGFCQSPWSMDTSLQDFERIHCYTKQNVTVSFYDDYLLGGTMPINCNTFSIAQRQNLNTAQLNDIKVQVYPNPTTNTIYFDNSKNSFNAVSIYNTIGQELKTKNLENSINEEIDLTGFASGVYYLKFSNEYSNSTIKVVKQ